MHIILHEDCLINMLFKLLCKRNKEHIKLGLIELVTKLPSRELLFNEKMVIIQLTFTCLKSILETLEKGGKKKSKLTIKTPKRRQ